MSFFWVRGGIPHEPRKKDTHSLNKYNTILKYLCEDYYNPYCKVKVLLKYINILLELK